MSAACLLTLVVLRIPELSLVGETTTPAAALLAQQTLSAIDVFAEHHIAAPPRQEIVRQVIAALRSAAKLDLPIGIGPQLARLTEDQQFLDLLTDEWERVLAALPADNPDITAPSLLWQAIRDVIAVAPGRNLLHETQAHIVEEQLAANRYVGTGIQLGGARDGTPPQMLHVFPDGPAYNVGAVDGDKILEIDGLPTEGLSLVEVVRLLRAPAGSDVEVLLQQNKDEPRRYTITRGVVPIKQTRIERREQSGRTIDVIRFDRVTSASVSDLRKIEQEWTSPPGAVLLDLQTGGFDLHQAVLLADALLDGGTIGRLETAQGSRSFEAGREALFADIPLFVIVSGSTFGTTEWVAAALQDQGRATIIGQQSAGQPFVSESFDVPGTNFVMTLTTGILKRADGRGLVRTTSPRNRPVVAMVRRQKNGHAEPDASPAPHDGGVVPVRTIAIRSRTPMQSDFAGRTFLGGPVTIEEAITLILPLVPAAAGPPEVD